jgi:hypothetical protein
VISENVICKDHYSSKRFFFSFKDYPDSDVQVISRGRIDELTSYVTDNNQDNHADKVMTPFIGRHLQHLLLFTCLKIHITWVNVKSLPIARVETSKCFQVFYESLNIDL